MYKNSWIWKMGKWEVMNYSPVFIKFECFFFLVQLYTSQSDLPTKSIIHQILYNYNITDYIPYAVL